MAQKSVYRETVLLKVIFSLSSYLSRHACRLLAVSLFSPVVPSDQRIITGLSGGLEIVVMFCVSFKGGNSEMHISCIPMERTAHTNVCPAGVERVKQMQRINGNQDNHVVVEYVKCNLITPLAL